jgi:hypothetical protein
MAHKWEELPSNKPEHLMSGPRRECVNCGARQVKEQETAWGRVIGYKWWPLVGRCKP